MRFFASSTNTDTNTKVNTLSTFHDQYNPMTNRLPSEDVNRLFLIKGKEEYRFYYRDSDRKEILRTLGRYAGNPALSLSWYDAAVLAQKVRKVSGDA